MPPSDHAELKELILENQRLLKENNRLLKKMRGLAILDFCFRLLVTLLFLGLPFIAYLYVVEHYSEQLDKAFKSIQIMSKMPGLEGLLIQYNRE